MFKGFYTVATGMIAQQRRTELLTNNLSNANTPGFKADQSTIRSFPDMLMSSVGNTNATAKQQMLSIYESSGSIKYWDLYARNIAKLHTGSNL